MKIKEPPNEYRGYRRVRGFGSNLIHAVKPEKPMHALCGQYVKVGRKATAGTMAEAKDLDFVAKPCAKCKEFREARVANATKG
jgi:hypothetical protein